MPPSASTAHLRHGNRRRPCLGLLLITATPVPPHFTASSLVPPLSAEQTAPPPLTPLLLLTPPCVSSQLEAVSAPLPL